MPIITDPSKLSMPEQVQKNKDDIEALQNTINNQQAELDAKATSAKLAQEVQDRKDADEDIEEEIQSIRDAQSVSAVVNSAALDSRNKLILVKDGTAAPGNTPLELTANANLLAEQYEYNGSGDITGSYFRTTFDSNNNEVVFFYNQPIRSRSQVVLDLDSMASQHPNIYTIRFYFGPYGTAGGCTNGDFIIKLKSFTSTTIASKNFYFGFGNYSQGVQPYLEILDPNIPAGFTIRTNGLNLASAAHYFEATVSANTAAKIILVSIRNGIAYIYIRDEQ